MVGCDGRMRKRNYYTQRVKIHSNDTVILTSGYAKYRCNKLDLGNINSIPRLLDVG